jgi:hypothetical protein
VIGLFGAALAAGDALGVVGERLEADAGLAAGTVEEQVRGDAVQPALERAGAVVVERPEHADEDLLGEVLRICPVSCQPVCQPVHTRRVRANHFIPAGWLPRFDAEDIGHRHHPPFTRQGRSTHCAWAS